MMKLKYKGYNVHQDINNCITLIKGEEILSYGISNERLTKKELKEQVDNWLNFLSKIKKET